jgi:hypothetical protein
MLSHLKWWIICHFSTKWGSKYIASLFQPPPFNDCLFDYDEVYVSPCSLKSLNHTAYIEAGLAEWEKPDFGGYPIKTGREYVPYIAWVFGVTKENDPRGEL